MPPKAIWCDGLHSNGKGYPRRLQGKAALPDRNRTDFVPNFAGGCVLGLVKQDLCVWSRAGLSRVAWLASCGLQNDGRCTSDEPTAAID